MDFVRPVEALIPGAQGRLLAVLARVEAELPVTTVAELAGVGRTQASTILGELAALGVISRKEVGRTVLVSLDRASAAGRLVGRLARLRTEVLEEIGVMARRLEPMPASVAVFGSFARGDAGADSDIDILIVRPLDVDEAKWADALIEFAGAVTQLAGNRAQLHEVEVEELSRRARSGRMKPGQMFWSSVLVDSITLVGSDPQHLVGARRAAER